jgi:hypothetical protein
MFRNALVVLGCSFILAVAQVQAVKAANTAVLQPLEDKAPALPVTCTFEKVTEGENGPYILKLKNVSNNAIAVSVQVLSSVTFHANSRIRNFPDHVIDPGQVWTITELAASDKVTVSAKGLAPTELAVP